MILPLYIIITFTINIINTSYSNCGNIYNPTEKSNCQSIEIDQNNKCCFVKYSLANNQFTQCVPLIYELKAIKSYGKMLHDASDLEILCKGNLIEGNFNFILFIIFILFF